MTLSESNPGFTSWRANGRRDRAPGTVLPGRQQGAPGVYYIGDHTDRDGVLLGFYAAERLADASFLDWFSLLETIDTFVVSNVSRLDRAASTPISLERVPVLQDVDGAVANRYGADYDTDPTGTVVLVGSGEQIRETWDTDVDASEIYDTVRTYMHDTHTADRGTDQ